MRDRGRRSWCQDQASLPGDPADCVDGMGGRHEQVSSAHGHQRWLLMDCWDRFFFDHPEMELPGRDEAFKRAIQRSQEL